MDVVAIPGSDTMTFQWCAPQCEHRHGPIVSYSYILSEVDSDTVISDSTNEPFVSLENLSPYTNYSFTVSAHTDAGEGPSYTLIASTKPGGKFVIF